MNVALQRAHRRGPTLCARIEAQLRAHPERVAVCDERGELRYGELERASAGVAAALRRAGVRAGDRVALLVPRSTKLLTGLVGILRAGAAYVPLDLDAPPERRAWTLEDSGAKAIVTIDAHTAALPPLPRVLVDESPRGDEEDDERDGLARDDSLLYVIYTSGSTGRPKGVMNGERAVLNTLDWLIDELALGPDDVFLQKTSIGFDVSVFELLVPLLLGARLVMARPGGASDPEHLRELIWRERVTIVHFVPTILRAFLSYASCAGLESLRVVAVAGEALDPELARACMAAIPAELINLYGPTEAAIITSYWWCRRGDDAAPIGFPIANTALLVLDEALAPVPDGEVGELFLGGVGLADGYLGRPRETAQRFIDHPVTGERLYRTGDRARRRADGAFEYLGRLDAQVKVRGFRIELEEIERALEQLAPVRGALVQVRDASTSHAHLVAYVVPADPAADPALTERALRVALSERLPRYMIPARIGLLEALPTLPSGKLDRGAAPPLPPAPRVASEAPQLESERLLSVVEIVCGVLGLERVPRETPLSELGATSLDLVDIVARAQARGLALRLAELPASATATTLAALARAPAAAPLGVSTSADRDEWPEGFPMGVLRGWSAEELRALRAEPGVADVYLPSPVQSTFLRMSGGAPAPMAVIELEWELATPLDLARLEASWSAIVERHEILRTRFLSDGGRQPVARVLASSSVARDAALVSLSLRDERRLALRAHHAVLDAWSIDLLMAELWARYDGAAAREGPALAYSDYARWTASEDPRELLERNEAILAGYEAPALPRRGWVHGPREELELAFGEDATARIDRWALAARSTPTSIVLLAWALALARAHGRSDLVHSVVQHGRTRGPSGVERLVGPTLGTSLMRLRFAHSDSVSALLARVEGLVEAGREDPFPRDWLAHWRARGDDNPWSSRFIDEGFRSFYYHPAGPRWDRASGRAARLVRLGYQDCEPLTALLLRGPELVLRASYASLRHERTTIASVLEDARALAIEIAQTRRLRVGELLGARRPR